jgi:hypothetical protein
MRPRSSTLRTGSAIETSVRRGVGLCARASRCHWHSRAQFPPLRCAHAHARAHSPQGGAVAGGRTIKPSSPLSLSLSLSRARMCVCVFACCEAVAGCRIVKPFLSEAINSKVHRASTHAPMLLLLRHSAVHVPAHMADITGADPCGSGSHLGRHSSGSTGPLHRPHRAASVPWRDKKHRPLRSGWATHPHRCDEPRLLVAVNLRIDA